KNLEHSIKLQLSAGNVGFMRRLPSIDDKCQFSSINLPCGQPTSGNISTACRACSVPLCSAPDQGDSCIMQKENGYVNDYVVIIFSHYIIVCGAGG
ncbi:hypothetical protein A243_14696, partial [Pseudomonas syringae pv. actinidiae ICMP 18883]